MQIIIPQNALHTCGQMCGNGHARQETPEKPRNMHHINMKYVKHPPFNAKKNLHKKCAPCISLLAAPLGDLQCVLS